MRQCPAWMTDHWRSGDFVGQGRNFGRVTIQRPKMALWTPEAGQVYASFAMPQVTKPRELPNIRKITIDTTNDTDAATCTVDLWNTEPLPLGAQPERSGRFDRAGWYTYNRGANPFADRWGQTTNEWRDWLVYDRIIRTYEGYGFDAAVAPEHDENLVLTGTWIIDDVIYKTDGTIQLKCRDFGRLLIDHIAFPPVVPLKHYPISFTAYYTYPGPKKVTVSGSGWSRPAYANDSGTPYVGRNGDVHGHQASQAFDSKGSTYWLSIGNDRPNADYSFEWVEGRYNGNLTAIKFHVRGGPYRAYISVKAGGSWKGRADIPYNPRDPISAPNGADIKYVKSVHVGEGDWLHYKFPKTIKNVSRVRITLTGLYNSGIGPFPYRASIYDIQCTGQTVTEHDTTKRGGNYGDYTEIVKRLLAWGGFTWPAGPDKRTQITHSDGSYSRYPCPSNDRFLKWGRIWGDLEMSGTNGPAKITEDTFDKKPLMDGITYVKQILGFITFVDQTGGFVFRSPNLWKLGNWKGDLFTGKSRTETVLQLDENNVILAPDGVTATLSGRNLRERYFVANTNGRIGATSPDKANAKYYNPYPVGFRRVAGWTDQHFASKKECRIMADLIALRSYITVRQDAVRIVGYPGIQVDDQVQIIEEVTGEGYVHYVQTVHSENDLEGGTWTMDLATNWLGTAPGGKWIWKASQFSDDTYAYLHALGKI